jgi:tRNA dimethylallyltransferase
MNKLLVIVGPTATGKTALAVELTKKFNGQIISADSRQVYRGMDIGTGKDKPNGIIIWGYDLVDPDEEFNVAAYQKYAREKIMEICNKNELPILVGGTGFYIKSVVDEIDSIHVPKDPVLREQLQNKNAFELFQILAQKDPMKAKIMNKSDRNNPRRLIRAIEVAQAGHDYNTDEVMEFDSLYIGLTCEFKKLKEIIKKRVAKRIKSGMEEEVVSLLRKAIDWQSQALNTLGYRQWQHFLQGEISIEQLEENWAKEEYQYAKRQMTWFKRDNRITWFDINDPISHQGIENLVEKWYHNA